jgi:tetratricopeptide (TPR) repeat protein
MLQSVIPGYTQPMRFLIVLALLLPSALAQTPLRSADDFVKEGIQAFEGGRYEDAAEFFRRAIELNPNEQNRMYLGTTYSSQVVPNLGTPENQKIANSAIEQFDIILTSHPDHLVAILHEASIYRNTQRPEIGRKLYKFAQTLDPRNSEIPYTIGAIDWLEAYQNTTALLATEGLTDKSDGNIAKSPALCEKFIAKNSALVDDALVNLTKAVALNPDYEEALTYLSLIYRRKADLRCDDSGAVIADIDQAIDWQKKSAEARSRNEAKRKGSS